MKTKKKFVKKGYKFGKRSKAVLKTLHPDLQAVLLFAIGTGRYDFSLLEGHRDKATQNKYYDEGKSKLRYPKGKHNKWPSEAVDLVPYHKTKPHIDWNDVTSMRNLVFWIQGVGDAMKVNLRLGCDWNGNLKSDQSFVDAPHIEIKL